MRILLGMLIGLVYLGLAVPACAIDPNSMTVNGYTSFEIEKQIERAGNGDGDPSGEDGNVF